MSRSPAVNQIAGDVLITSDMTDTLVIKPNHRIAARIVDGQALILDPRTDELQRSTRWVALFGLRSPKRTQNKTQILTALVDEFQVDEAQARQDLDSFLHKLIERDLISYTSD